MPYVEFTLSDGTRQGGSGPEGETVMRLAVNSGIDGIVAACGGECACSTCHVYVAEEWLAACGTPSQEEQDTLELAIDRRPTSRLSCQITLTTELDGLCVQVPAIQAD